MHLLFETGISLKDNRKSVSFIHNLSQQLTILSVGEGEERERKHFLN